MSSEIWVNGVRREWADDELRKYHAFDAAGVEVLVRDYSDVENMRVNAGLPVLIPTAALEQIQAALISDLAALQTLIDTDNAVIRTNPAPYVKVNARALRRLVRLAIGDLRGAD